MPTLSNTLINAATEIGHRAAMRLHQRVKRDDLDRRGILDDASASLAINLEAEGAEPYAAVMARNLMIAAYANRLNDLYQTGTPGGTDGPASVI